MLLPHGTVIALVDGTKFELFRNTGTEAEPELTAQDTPHLETQNQSAGQSEEKGSHSGHHKGETVHAAAAVDWLNRQVLAHKLDNLVVIAAPRTLGEMRPLYHGQLESILLGELAKDFAGRSGAEILSALREHG